MKQITEDLFALQDKEYQAFHAKLIPNVPSEKVIGVRTPALRKYAKEAAKLPEIHDFLNELPHTYYEENNLHGALLGILYKDIGQYLEKLEQFLPYVNNWATCDMMSPKIFKKNLPLVYEYVKKWLKSKETYTVRFAIVTLLGFYLDEAKKSIRFDIVISFSNRKAGRKQSDADRHKEYEEILQRTKEKYPQYSIRVNLDSDVSD